MQLNHIIKNLLQAKRIYNNNKKELNIKIKENKNNKIIKKDLLKNKKILLIEIKSTNNQLKHFRNLKNLRYFDII